MSIIGDVFKKLWNLIIEKISEPKVQKVLKELLWMTVTLIAEEIMKSKEKELTVTI